MVITEKSRVTAEIIIDFVAKNAAPYKQLLGGIQFIDVIPKSAAGKILRKELVKQYHIKNN